MICTMVEGRQVDITAEVAAQKRQLREGLKRHGMTMTEFARICHCSPSNISAQLRNEWPIRGYIWKHAIDLGLVA